jgi:hypothetical protein
MKTTIHPLAEEYLRRLEHHARVLPRSERDELIAEIRDHVTSGLSADSTEADVRNLLDALGSPADIVDAARPENPPVRRGAREVFALILLVTGLPPSLHWLSLLICTGRPGGDPPDGDERRQHARMTYGSVPLRRRIARSASSSVTPRWRWPRLTARANASARVPLRTSARITAWPNCCAAATRW